MCSGGEGYYCRAKGLRCIANFFACCTLEVACICQAVLRKTNKSVRWATALEVT